MEHPVFVKTNSEFKEKLNAEVPKVFKSGEKIAIKLHMGETGNPNHLKPAFVKVVTDVLKEIGAKPFLIDTAVRYHSPRKTVSGYMETARKNGFTKEFMGCDIVISDSYVESAGKYLTYEIAKELAEADGVLVLTHVKGHLCTGLGGAIKNIGMGALSPKSKGDIHDGGSPVYAGGCTLCKSCSEVCPVNAIKYSAEKPSFDYESCVGCSKCFYACKSNAIRPKVAVFDALLADAAKSALNVFKKAYFVSVLRDITKFCDCSIRKDNMIVLGDVGIVMGSDIVAVERMTHEKIVSAAGRDLFLEIWKKSPLVHIGEFERL